MIYYEVATDTRLTEGEATLITGELGKSMEEVGIVILEEAYPKAYDPELYTLSDGGNEAFSEEREFAIQVPFGMLPGTPDAGTTKQTVSGYRIKWVMTPKDIDTVRTVLKTRLSAKKKQVEDSGITMANGISVATEKDDRDRILAMKVAYDDNPDNPLLGTMEFKTASGRFVAFDKALILPIFRIMTDRTLQVFAREATIQKLLWISENPQDAIDVYFEEINSGWPPSVIPA